MVYFQHVMTRSDGPESYISGVSGLAGYGAGGAYRVYSASGQQGGLLARDPAQAMAVTDTVGFAQAALDGRAGVARLEVASLGGRDVLISFGQRGGAQGFWLEADPDGGGGGGGADLAAAFTLPGLAGHTLLAVQTMALSGGRDMVFTSSLQGLGVTAWLRQSDGRLREMQPLLSGGETQGYDVLAMAAVPFAGGAFAGGAGEAGETDDAGFLLTAQAQGNTLACWRVGADGRSVLVASLGTADGLAVSAPNLLRVVELAGQSYALLGAAGSGSVAVIRLDSTGGLRVTDQVIDDLHSRFQGISVLETITLGDRVFVLAGGADDGLSLMTLLPGGRLLLLATIADTLDTALENISAASLRANGDGLDIFVTGWSEHGLSQFRVDLGALAPIRTATPAGGDMQGGAQGDLLQGGAGADRLFGGAGADILIDGAGVDLLTGGAGADVFVFTPDGRRDDVRDFTLGEDALDLSALGRLYSREALSFVAMAGGIEIRFGAERLLLFSADGAAISPAALTDAMLFGLSHVAPVLVPDAGQVITGSGLADVLQGRGGDDALTGGGGADQLLGAGGADSLNGEYADAAFDPVAAQVYRLYRATLDREPDRAGHSTWTGRLMADDPNAAATDPDAMGLGAVIAGFTASREFQARYGATSDADFVTLLYNNVLDRAPDAGGLRAWTTALANGTLNRAGVVQGFSESAEFQGRTEAAAMAYGQAGYQADWSDDVYRLYRATLNRAPDLAGLLGWSAALAEGRGFLDVVQGFTGSREFQARYGTTSDAGFVTLLYNNVLNRAPDAAGFASWTGLLAAGTQSRAEVVRGFAQSREFTASTAGDVLGFMRGTGADDRLAGGAGNNLLFGGFGADTFVFDKTAGNAGGTQRVADLERWDLIALTGFGYGSAAEAMTHLRQSGDDVVFADQGLHITFADTGLAAFFADMFVI